MEEKETSFGGGKGNLVVYSQSWGKLDKTLSCSNTCKCTTALCSHGHPDTLPCVLEGRRHCFLGTEAAGSCSVACKVLCSLMALYRHFRVNIFVGALRAEQSTDLLCCRGLIAGMGSSELLALPTHTHTSVPIHLGQTNSILLLEGNAGSGQKRLAQPPC